MTLRSKLILSIIGPMIVMFIIIFWFTLNKIYQYNLEQLHVRYTLVARNQATHMGSTFRFYSQSAKHIANTIELSENFNEEQLLKTYINNDELIHGAVIAYEKNQHNENQEYYAPYIYREGDEFVYYDLADRNFDYTSELAEWYFSAKKTGESSWTEPYRDYRSDNALIISYTVPFFRDNNFAGVVALDINLEKLQKEITQNSLVKDPFIIISSKGNFISHPQLTVLKSETMQDRVKKSADPVLMELMDDMLQGKSGVKKVDKLDILSDEPFWIFYAPIYSTTWSFATALPEKEIVSFLNLQIIRGLIGVFILLTMIIITILFISKHITRPVTYLADVVKQIGDGNFDLKIKKIKSKDEIGDLANAFSKMLAHLRTHIDARAREEAQRKLVDTELQLARQIQASLLPDNFPKCADTTKYDLFAMNVSAGQVGGDFYDFFKIDENRFLFLIADVSGKGAPAALIMAITKTLIRELAKHYSSTAEILKQTNCVLIDMHKQPVFVTMFLGIYETITGQIHYANAGHQLPYVLCKDGTTRQFGETTGTIVGMLEEAEYTENNEQLDTDEYLIGYTDGITEARSPDGKFYGEHHLASLLKSCRNMSPREICELLISDVTAFQAKHLADDITILALKRCH